MQKGKEFRSGISEGILCAHKQVEDGASK